MEAVADQQILRGVTATLRWQNLDGDGSAVAPAGAVTVGVVDHAGSTVIAPGTATGGTGTNPRTVSLPAASNTTLDLLTATWTDAGDASTHTTTIEVVGGYLFSVAEARAADPILANEEKWSDAAILEQRRKIEEEFEQVCDVAFVPRFRVDRCRGHGGCSLILSKPRVRTVRSVAAYTADTPTAWTVGELAALEFGAGVTLWSRAGKAFPYGPVVVAYEHGYDRPPAELKTAAFQRLRYLLAQPMTGIPDRATSFSVIDGGSYRLDVAGKWKTGQPDVDAVLDRWSERIPGVS